MFVQAGVQKLLISGEWNEAHRAILTHLVPAVLVPRYLPPSPSLTSPVLYVTSRFPIKRKNLFPNI